MLDFIFNNPRIQFGELLLWDERVAKYIISDLPDYFGQEVTEYLALNPNIYSVHKVMFDKQYVPTFSFAELNPETGTVKTCVIGLLGHLKHTPNQKWGDNLNKKIENYTRFKVNKVMRQFASLKSDSGVINDFSASISTIHILLSQHIDKSLNEPGDKLRYGEHFYN
ncbi:MAG: hypothetical protein AAGJ08_25100 [Cyanobacteria bacterium P01_H01_bin.35]